MNEETRIEKAYALAREHYAEWGVDTEAALSALDAIPVSLPCWQGDDVRGFEGAADLSGSGLAVPGARPGRARHGDELRADLDRALSLLPGPHRVNLHAIYAETGGTPVERDALEPEHFSRWRDWAGDRGLGLDMNPTFFAHPRAADGLTLTHPDPGIREFWIAHGAACRRIGASLGRAAGSACVTNVWIPDGFRDEPADRGAPRDRLRESLDAVFAEPLEPAENLDSVESKLFGLGTEGYVAGSYDFYVAYALSRRKLLCLDTGHFHPTESVADKISALLPFLPGLLLHVSRGVRWDSDHVPALDDALLSLAREVAAGDRRSRIRLALDHFEAGINRVAAWVAGARNLRKALLAALLRPGDLLRAREAAGDATGLFVLGEEAKDLPRGAVWDRYCLVSGVPPGRDWIEAVEAYERDVIARREG